MQTHKTHISAKQAESLLFPIAAFLRAGGITKTSATERLAAAFDRTKSLDRARRMEHIGRPKLYADIVAMWGHDPKYLDPAGRPRALSMEGKNELRALIRAACNVSDPRKVVGVLIRFGSVRRGRNGKYQLVRPLFYTSTNRAMAFEPIAYFLSDASSTLERILRRTSKTRAPELFWRKVESSGLSPASARKFVAFVRERGQVFLEELDDWLEANSIMKGHHRKNEKLRRVGLGLFSIDSTVDLSNSDP